MAVLSVGGLYWALPEALTPGPGWLALAVAAPLSLVSMVLYRRAKFRLNQIAVSYTHLLPGVEQIAIHTPVLLFSTVVSMATVLLFGLAPAMRSSTATLGARAASPGVAHRRFLDAIVVAELAVSVLLLTGAGLTMRSVYGLYHDMGFRADHVLTFRTPVGRDTPPQRLARFYQDCLLYTSRCV